ncbi:MAG TPA: response regulator [Syntrophomonas sp.]|nr:response regulator [Syntrophomonas sp.]HRW11852.1 response regulator [Syntrophomonas sp.]
MLHTKIMVVDDSNVDIALIKSILTDYDLITAGDGVEAMELLQEYPDTEIMILDLNMPRMNGFEVLEAMRKHPVYKKVTVLILTNYDETENEIKGLDMGALDYIRKPINIQSLRKRIQVHTHLRRARQQLQRYNEILEKTVQERTRELVITRDVSIHAMVILLEKRSIESSHHAKRTQWIMKALCEHLSSQPIYQNVLTEEYIKELFDTAPLHDIGKVGIPDRILLKPGPLDERELAIMKKHTTYGVEALQLGNDENLSVSFIKTAIEIAGTHHEKYDGTGYPNQLKGEEIPLSGRLMAVIDVYDAIISQRVYKPPYEHTTALAYLLEERGKSFDPTIVDAFLQIEKMVEYISKTFKPY